VSQAKPLGGLMEAKRRGRLPERGRHADNGSAWLERRRRNAISGRHLCPSRALGNWMMPNRAPGFRRSF
jgi:hypothetical protein